MEVGRISANPVARQPLPKADAGAPRYFTPAQAQAILAELAQPWLTACDLDMRVGLRLGELLGVPVPLAGATVTGAAGDRTFTVAGLTAANARTGSYVLTVVAGPLNYVGVNPKVDCPAVDLDVEVPQPSK